MDVVVCNVGGGGLVNGVCEGVYKYGLEDGVKVVVFEIEGVDLLF